MVATVAVAVLLAGWWLCSALAQYRPLRRRLLTRWDLSVLGPFLPVYTFFAPRPAVHDLRLMVRYWHDDDPLPWWEFEVAEPWRWYHLVWNPTKRQGKALSDLMREMAHLGDVSPVARKLSNCYLQLLTLVDAEPAPPGATHVQFAVVETAGFHHPESARLFFGSERHRLGRPAPAAV